MTCLSLRSRRQTTSTALPKVRAMGFTGFISKPIDFRLFALQIKRILDGEGIWLS